MIKKIYVPEMEWPFILSFYAQICGDWYNVDHTEWNPYFGRNITCDTKIDSLPVFSVQNSILELSKERSDERKRRKYRKYIWS